jgi:hypothetical protein
MAGNGMAAGNGGLLRSVVAAAVFIVCERSPAPVRDQGKSNLFL